jgi:hypothetical protein
VLGIVLSGSAVMQRVAETLSEHGLSEAKMASIERRLARFIGNSRIVVPMIWKLFLTQVLTPFRGQQVHFVLDNTPFREDLTIVYLGLLVHSRVLPVAWAVMPAQTTWDEGQWDIVGRGARPGACTSARHILYPTRRSWVSRHADAASFVPIVGGIICYGCVQSIRGRASSMGNSSSRGSALTRSCGTARLSLVWPSQSLARGNAGDVRWSGPGPRL